MTPEGKSPHTPYDGGDWPIIAHGNVGVDYAETVAHVHVRHLAWEITAALNEKAHGVTIYTTTA